MTKPDHKLHMNRSPQAKSRSQPGAPPMKLTALITTAAAMLAASAACAQPVVTNRTTSVYATVPEPVALAFAADGTLYVGRNSGTGSDAHKILRVAPGGSPVTEFGDTAIPDPDVVIVDRLGLVSGTPGSVLVGGVVSGTSGRISKIAPDGTVTALFGPSPDYDNPTGFAFDDLGRFYFTTHGNGQVYRSDGGVPVPIITLAQANTIEVDALGRLTLNADNATALRLHATDGTLLNASFATVRAGTPIARAPGGDWGDNLLVVGPTGLLLRLDADGTTTALGSGFAGIDDLRFGPDGELYASDWETDQIYRCAQPTVPGATTTVYARVTDPIKISFAPDGTLYVGRDNSGSGGGNGDPVKIHSIAPGGSPVTERGNAACYDPDAVIFDVAGTVSGTPGAVIIGGENPSSQAILSKLVPGGVVSAFFGPSSAIINPSDFVFDDIGRLLFTDIDGGKVYAMTGPTPVAVCSLPLPLNVAVDAAGRIVVNASEESVVRLYTAAGGLITSTLAPAQPRTPIARGAGRFFGTDIFCVNTNGNLLRVSTTGTVTVAGTGFGGLEDFAFGPDGALYASHFGNDLIWRVMPDDQIRLTITRTATNSVVVSWAAPAVGWVLERTNALSATVGDSWPQVPPPYQSNAGVISVTITNTPASGNQFFRLHKP
jgi:sugar lactone lactonase YvrE